MGRGARCRLKISLIRARDLRAADFNFTGGKSDPYCTCELFGRPQTQIKSDIIKKTLDPEWNYDGVIESCRAGDDLEFCVYDFDVVGDDDLLGKAILEYDAFYPFGYEGDLTLEHPKKKDSAITVKIQCIPLREDDEDKPRCYVKIHKAESLRAADWGGSSDPYVITRVPGKTQSKFRTKVIRNTINPEWDEEDEIIDYEMGDDLEFVVYDWDRMSADDELGRIKLEAGEFLPNGYSGWLQLTKGRLMVSVELYIPVPPRPPDPAEHVTPEDRKPAPFQLRCMDTGRTHRLASYTEVGRSKRQLDPRYDLILDSPGIADVSRVNHAVIKCWCGVDPSSWRARVYTDQDTKGVGFGPGGGHSAGGTSVDNEPVELWCGTEIVPGSVVRFGVREMWVVEKAVIFQKSQAGEVACQKAKTNAEEDPAMYRELKVPSGACQHALQHCVDWDSFVRVVLEWCGEPDEPPCADVIEVLDECGASTGRFEAKSLEAQEAFKVRSILKEVRMGCTIKLRLSSEPTLLAPIMRKLDAHLKRMADNYESRGAALFSGFG
mmetsp:Transcript_69036/g.173969  ORF Transcript_69036/g.173969 Transcript_69036/m.173969 type:complete len:549 (+) Transcript_69036:184-1830(+)